MKPKTNAMPQPGVEFQAGDQVDQATEGLRFVSRERTVYRGNVTIATCSSRTMARRIANALNQYKANERGE